jgi:chromosome segregation ATPase
MSDPAIPLSVLARFHREVIVPDIERIVGGAIEQSDRRLRDEMHTLHGAVLSKLDRLEFEYQAIKSGLVRVEGRLDALEAGQRELTATVHELAERLGHVEQRLGRVEKRLDELTDAEAQEAVRAEVQGLRSRVDALQAQIEAVQKRLDG